MDRAEKTAQESLIDLPFKNEASKLILIRVAESRHDFPGAIASGKSLLSENIGNAAILSTLVSSHLGFGKSQEASEYANKLVAASPFMDSFALRALTLLAQGRNDEAMNDFKKALSIEEADQRLSSTSLRALMGRHYYRMGQMETAMLYTESALRIDADYHVALAQKADILAAQRNSEEANKLYGMAYKQREEPPYLLAQANLKERAGDINEAENLRVEAEESIRSEIDTTPYGHYNELAQVLIERGNPSQREEAIVAGQKNVEQRMTSESYHLLAQAFLNAERFDEARAAIQPALSSGETNCEYTYLALKIENRAVGRGGLVDTSTCPQTKN